ncbi:hypothetical protein [Aureivirga marina]|uniref:hypothetical protein n=1 Tax=Aureivirga marina TaxID=1182451 RepID=UPI0018CBAC5C|nr:hypothetical protein [Aureivirga marina]
MGVILEDFPIALLGILTFFLPFKFKYLSKKDKLLCLYIITTFINSILMAIMAEKKLNNVMIAHVQIITELITLILFANEFFKNKKIRFFNLCFIHLFTFCIIVYFVFLPNELKKINLIEITFAFLFKIIIFSILIYKSYTNKKLFKYSPIFFTIVIYFTVCWVIFFSFNYFIQKEMFDILLDLLVINDVLFFSLVIIFTYFLLNVVQENENKLIPIFGKLIQKINSKFKIE